MQLEYSEIGEWSEVKLDIVQEYGRAYSTIMNDPKRSYLHHAYVDAFAGSGTHVSKSTGDFISGSPVNALNVDLGLTRFRGPIRVKRSGSVKGVEDGQQRQTLLA